MFIMNTHSFFLVLILGAALMSCGERTINPYEDDEGIFSIYGALNVNQNPNIIRVRNLSEPLQSDSFFPLDATVTFTDLQTGATTVLKDSIVTFPAGKTHNFILNEMLEVDSQYQVTVERSDGAISQAFVTTPGVTEASYHPLNVFYCEEPMQLRFDNVHPPEFIKLEVGVIYEGKEHWAPVDLVGEFRYDTHQDLMVMDIRPRNLLVNIFTPPLPDNPYFDPYLLFPTVQCDELDRELFMFRYSHFGPDWAGVLVDEQTPIDIEFGDVENGLGFLGAYRTGEFSFEFVPDLF